MEAKPSSPSPPLEQPLCCPGCQTREPTLLPCGHRLCSACLQLCQQELGPPGCTVCYGRELLDSVLHGLLDSLFQGQPRRDVTEAAGGAPRVCTHHGQALTLFCTDDEELLCIACQEKDHEKHECCPLEEAVQDCKTELRSALKTMQEKLEDLKTSKQNCDDLAEHIKAQKQQTERLIKEEFEKLHQFLRNEEAALVTALKEEEQQKSQKMNENIEKVARDIQTLSDTIKMVEEEMDTDDIPFLKNFKTNMRRAQCPLKEPDIESGALIDVAKHLSNLKFRVWEKMQGAVEYSPVTLDPNTADVCLSVSDDLTTVQYLEEDQHLPDNKERFSAYECVLGSEALSSGWHSWDVEVGDNSQWALGVAKDTVPRKEWFPPNPEQGLWSIGLSAGEYRARTPIATSLALKRKPQRIRVQLDWEGGRLTFSDAGDNTLLYKFKHRFSERVFPYFSSACKRHPLRVLPGKASVMLE